MKPSKRPFRIRNNFSVNVLENTYMIANCGYKDCKKNSEFISSEGYIKLQTIVAVFTINYDSVVYCRECIPKIYKDLKKELDVTLWAFK